MIDEIKKLLPPEADIVLKTPILVCILIAGADDDIDKKEIKAAIQFVNQKQIQLDSRLLSFYKQLAEDFEDKIRVLIQSYPYHSKQRNELIVSELKEINQILRKMNKEVAIEYYNSLLDIATKIASSSGGILGTNTIGTEENSFVKLPMIQPPPTD